MIAYEERDIASIVPDPDNPRTIGADALRSLTASVRRFGLVQPIVVNRTTGHVVGGHQRLVALQQLGETRAMVAVGDWSVAEERALNVTLNNPAVQGSFLGADRYLESALSGLSAEDFRELSLDTLAKCDHVDEHSSPTLVVEVDIPDELPVKTITQLGDAWTLGDSRLVCGDMTAPGVVAAALAGGEPTLLWTDPPWNVAKDAADIPCGKNSTRTTRTTIMNDALGANYAPFVEAFVGTFAAVCAPGTPIYVAMSAQEWSVVDTAIKAVGFYFSSMIIWAKQSLILSRKDFHPQFEPLWYGWREGASRRCAPAERAMSDLWAIDRPRKSDQHPTMKPIALVARSLNASSRSGDLVLDPFAGSGTTLLAAAQMGRRAALVELDPAYCDVIVERWQTLTGGTATRASSGAGRAAKRGKPRVAKP